MMSLNFSFLDLGFFNSFLTNSRDIKGLHLLFLMVDFEVEIFLVYGIYLLEPSINFLGNWLLYIHLSIVPSSFLSPVITLTAFSCLWRVTHFLFDTGVVLMFVKMISLPVVQVQEILCPQTLNSRISNSQLQFLWIEKQARMMVGIHLLLLRGRENSPVAHCCRTMFFPLKNLLVMGIGISSSLAILF